MSEYRSRRDQRPRFAEYEPGYADAAAYAKPTKPWYRRKKYIVIALAIISGLITIVIGLLNLSAARDNRLAAEANLRIAEMQRRLQEAALKKYEDTPVRLQTEAARIVDTSAQFRRDSILRDIRVAMVAHGLDLELSAAYEYRLFDTTNYSYASGRYMVSESPTATRAMHYLRDIAVPLVERSLGSFPAAVVIKGTADGRNVRRDATYANDLGVIRNVGYTDLNSGDEKLMTLGTGDRLTNDRIAFLRGYAMRYEMRASRSLVDAKFAMQTFTYSAPDTGGAFRTTRIQVTLKDALVPVFDGLPTRARQLAIDSVRRAAASRGP